MLDAKSDWGELKRLEKCDSNDQEQATHERGSGGSSIGI
jgi:hypothetical protein